MAGQIPHRADYLWIISGLMGPNSGTNGDHFRRVRDGVENDNRTSSEENSSLNYVIYSQTKQRINVNSGIDYVSNNPRSSE